jgi:hypothetical protein
MRRTFAILLILLVSAVVAAAQVSGEWIKHTSREGRYSVLLPNEPKLSTESVTAKTGESLPQYVALSSGSEGVFYVSYSDYLSDMTFSFDDARDGMLAAAQGTLISENSISLGGAPGRELKVLFKVSGAGEYINSVRFYDVGRRIYLLQYFFPKTEDGSVAVTAKAKKFLDSFKVEASR